MRPGTPARLRALLRAAKRGNGEALKAANNILRQYGVRAVRPGKTLRRYWTPDEDALLRQLYPTHTAEEVGARLGRNERSVFNRAERLGLSKAPGFQADRARQRWAEGRHENSRKACFRKGHKPANKGKAWDEWLPPASRKRCRATQFKAGRRPQDNANYQPIGSLRTSKDGYLERKVTDDQDVYPARRWVAVHRLVWEAANGPIPDGHAVVFRPGMRTTVESEITVDRMECITRAELMRRNSYHTRYPPEIARLIQLRGALNRKINRRTREQAPKDTTP